MKHLKLFESFVIKKNESLSEALSHSDIQKISKQLEDAGVLLDTVEEVNPMHSKWVRAMLKNPNGDYKETELVKGEINKIERAKDVLEDTMYWLIKRNIYVYAKFM